MANSLVRQKFGAAAADYAASTVHAAGPSLARLVALIETKPTWRVLDIATGAGHTALAFAPKVAKVTATDITPEMLAETRRLAKERKLGNVVTAQAAADDLPFPDTSFNLVTCRLAAHHFPSPKAFMREAARVLIPGGTFALVDNISPDDQGLAAAYNAFEKLRDPSHGRCLSLAEWSGLIQGARLTIEASEVIDQDIAFDPWVKRMRCTPSTVTRLRDMLHTAPLSELLRPRDTDDGLTFTLREAIILTRKQPT
ncbi:MAG: class I SAM-dependent methyltransferase [Methyloceanibacter sp.]|uniref:class I SAM-dependent methyltransferase n=1 Tax=Methyloceanibacter sp. TaxID=1965321 RepID=UPI003D6D8DA2